MDVSSTKTIQYRLIDINVHCLDFCYVKGNPKLTSPNKDAPCTDVLKIPPILSQICLTNDDARYIYS